MPPKSRRPARSEFSQPRVVGIFGPFGSRVLVEMTADQAHELFPEEAFAGPAEVSEAVARDVAAMARVDKAIAESGHAATARALARELDHPWNSATSKSMCARALTETLDRLRELLPPEEEGDGLDDLAARRAARLGGAATAN